MKKILLTLFLASFLAGCTINYKVPEPKEPIKEVTIENLQSRTPTLQSTPLHLHAPECDISDIEILSAIRLITRDDFRESKNLIGYIEALERQQQLIIKVKRRYDDCKN